MSKTPEYYSGDTGPYIVKLKIGSTEYAVDSGDTVKASFVDETAGVAITSAVTQLSTTAGADWAHGWIAVTFDSTNANLMQSHAGNTRLLEIEVTKTASGKRTFHVDMAIKRGWIP
jgi:hypothetical protein